MWPPSIAIRPRNTGDNAFSVRSPLARPKHAAATALAREMGGVRQEAPSVRHMVIKSPRGSTTEMLILAPIAITLAFAAARICSASASVKDAIGFPPCAYGDPTGLGRLRPAHEGILYRGWPCHPRSHPLPAEEGSQSTLPFALPMACCGDGCQGRRGRFFDFQDIGSRDELGQVVEQLQVVRPFPGPRGEFDERRLFAVVEDCRHPENGVGFTRLGVVRSHDGASCSTQPTEDTTQDFVVDVFQDNIVIIQVARRYSVPRRWASPPLSVWHPLAWALLASPV